MRFTRLGGDRISYQVVGDGPFDLVLTNGSLNHIDSWWEHPASTHFMRRLASFSRLIMFDRRGTGTSDPPSPGMCLSWETWFDDLRAVMDAASSERAAIFANLDGPAIAIPFAATYPERTIALVLGNSTARWLWAEDYPCGLPREDLEMRVRTLPEIWGTENFSRLAYPARRDDEHFVRWYAKVTRSACAPKIFRAILEQHIAMDMRSVLPLVRAPTLVLHRREYAMVPPEQGRYIADHIQNARMVELAGASAFMLDGVDETADLVEQFLTGVRQGPVLDRALATVMFTDIVSSTDRAEAVGDARWRVLLDRHDEIVRQHVQQFQGRLVKGMGDGVLATFDLPGRAIRCSFALSDRLAELGVTVRVGLHAGEIELRDDDVIGISVHVAARVNALASAGEVLVTRTVRDLVAGSGLSFEARGSHQLKGVRDEWQLFAVRPA